MAVPKGLWEGGVLEVGLVLTVGDGRGVGHFISCVLAGVRERN